MRPEEATYDITDLPQNQIKVTFKDSKWDFEGLHLVCSYNTGGQIMGICSSSQMNNIGIQNQGAPSKTRKKPSPAPYETGFSVAAFSKYLWEYYPDVFMEIQDAVYKRIANKAKSSLMGTHAIIVSGRSNIKAEKYQAKFGVYTPGFCRWLSQNPGFGTISICHLTQNPNHTAKGDFSLVQTALWTPSDARVGPQKEDFMGVFYNGKRPSRTYTPEFRKNFKKLGVGPTWALFKPTYTKTLSKSGD